MLHGRRYLLFSTLMISIAITGSGCGGGSGKYDNKMKVQNYGHDGYMGLTNTNPNLPNSPNSLTIKSDTDFVGEKLRGLKGIQRSRVTIDGSSMHVRIDPDPSLNAAQRARLQSEATAIVQKNMPRYDVHVTVVH
ncbi:conserved hypothetical protein [Paenibacillus curdlanolyticus YK9]|uniref:Sporulation lipoprotein YhcN/YlaJ-like protein n=1 Tax=Paenibacillus curdlanolyticus YK9 TaxID=717606 RepID=E0IDD4_9BACL|nr:hypothetical protein [Paenibacillus curdlanolyticus]EFM09589.1 conserved hypothetical protein [Paenibacillus curdlanolyticus YK9]